jgi:hypothetical protein
MAEEVIGRGYVRLIQGFLERLRNLYAHHNRVLFYDDVVVVYLLAFFNPVLRSLRTIEDASQLPGINRFLDVEAVCKSTLSAANSLFDPAELEGLIADLRCKLPNLHQVDSDLASLLEQVKVFDGSFFRLAADVEWAIRSHNQYTKAGNKAGSGYVRLNLQLCLKTGCPSGVSINGRDGVGEGAAAAAMVTSEPGLIYLIDSGVVSFAYLGTILDANSHFLCSLATGVNFEATEQRTLDDKDIAAGVQSDRVGRLTGSDTRTAPDRTLREVVFSFLGRDGKTKTIRLLTDLLDLPAHLIAELYRYRWQVELFFRWLKVHANFRHLTSHSRNGITLGFYVATIACLLLCLHTQQALSLYGFNLMGMVAAGLGDLKDILPLLEHRQLERLRDKRRQAKKRAEKKKA